MICYKEQNLSLCSLYGVWGEDFYRKNANLEKKVSFYFFTMIFLRLLLLHRP